MSALCPIMKTPMLLSWASARRSSMWMLKPGMLSSLSRVPPVMPRPRPEIIGTQLSSQASNGASTSEVLSPMPPVECLSILGGEPSGYSSTVPLSIIAVVRCWVSAAVMPRKKTAIAQALIW
jgi:hypothetical protein